MSNISPSSSLLQHNLTASSIQLSCLRREHLQSAPRRSSIGGPDKGKATHNRSQHHIIMGPRNPIRLLYDRMEAEATNGEEKEEEMALFKVLPKKKKKETADVDVSSGPCFLLNIPVSCQLSCLAYLSLKVSPYLHINIAFSLSFLPSSSNHLVPPVQTPTGPPSFLRN